MDYRRDGVPPTDAFPTNFGFLGVGLKAEEPAGGDQRAPLIPGERRWLFHERDVGLLGDCLERIVQLGGRGSEVVVAAADVGHLLQQRLVRVRPQADCEDDDITVGGPLCLSQGVTYSVGLITSLFQECGVI